MHVEPPARGQLSDLVCDPHAHTLGNLAVSCSTGVPAVCLQSGRRVNSCRIYRGRDTEGGRRMTVIARTCHTP